MASFRPTYNFIIFLTELVIDTVTMSMTTFQVAALNNVERFLSANDLRYLHGLRRRKNRDSISYQLSMFLKIKAIVGTSPVSIGSPKQQPWQDQFPFQKHMAR